MSQAKGLDHVDEEGVQKFHLDSTRLHGSRTVRRCHSNAYNGGKLSVPVVAIFLRNAQLSHFHPVLLRLLYLGLYKYFWPAKLCFFFHQPLSYY